MQNRGTAENLSLLVRMMNFPLLTANKKTIYKPFGDENFRRQYLKKKNLEHEKTAFHAGSLEHSLILKVRDYLQVTNATIPDMSD